MNKQVIREDSILRVPTQILFSNSMCDLRMFHTQNLLGRHILKELGNLQQISQYVFWQNFQIPCVFPDRESFLQFSLCSGDPVYSFMASC